MMTKKTCFLWTLVLAVACSFQIAFALTFEGRVYEGNVGDESTPIPNVTVTLYGSQDPNYLGTVIISTTTDAKGWYGLEFRPGYEVYNIVETDPSGYSSVGATSVDGDVIDDNRIQYTTFEKPIEDQTLTGNKFWDDKPDDGTIGDWVWDDTNRNGLQDQGEPGVSGVKVELLDNNGNPLANTTTTSTGQYKFSGLAEGKYYVLFNIPSGYQFTPMDIGSDDTVDSDANTSTGKTDVIALSADEINKNVDAGLYEKVEEERDFGDAPDPRYPTFLKNNGARHLIDRSVYLGSRIDSEADGQPNADASGDDASGYDDEDGITFQNDLVLGDWTSFIATASVKGNLGVWVDFNGDGDWSDPHESIFNSDTTVFAGANHWGFRVPESAKLGKTAARFRYSTKGGQKYDGEWPDGEVEDYWVEIKEEAEGGNILIHKDALPKDNTPFPFSGDLGPFTLKSPSDSIITFAGAKPWTYKIQENTPAGWSLQDIKVNDPSGNSSIDLANATVKLVLDGKENISVSFVNRKEGEKDLDFSDAPDPTYPTLLVNNGARHLIDPKYHLGLAIDAEPDGYQSALSDGDDSNNINDEDGVFMSPFIAPGQAVPITVVASVSGALNAWLDYNCDGDWKDAGEHIIAAQPVNAGVNSFTINVPASAATGLSHARFRFSSQRQLNFDGYAPDGEVEDYPVEIKKLEKGTVKIIKDATPKDDTPFWFCAQLTGFFNIFCFPLQDPSNNNFIFLNPGNIVEISEAAMAGWLLTNITISGDTDNGSTIDIPNGKVKLDFDPGENIVITFYNEQSEDNLDFGDAPDSHNNPGYPTIHANNGAYHTINPAFILGSNIDPEPDGQPDPHALGDDNDGTDDEDGVTFPVNMQIGQNVTIKVSASNKGILNAWIDYNQNQSWADAGEHVLVDLSLNPGSNNLTFTIPPTALPGATFARFRFSRQTGLSYTGWGKDGEVEDYEIELQPGGDGTPLKWFQPPLKSRDPDFPFPKLFWGWDEKSRLGDVVIADDWFCRDPRPVTGIRWWGSYLDWEQPEPPEHAPAAFHLGMWTDVPKGVDSEWSHPGELVWEFGVERFATDEKVVGGDFMPDHMEKPDSCFEYYVELPKENWFYQEKDSTVYWLSVAAIYEEPPEIHPWGWKTRELYFNDLGVRIVEPKEFGPDTQFKEGEPIGDNWDMTFVLSTTEYIREFDFGDAPGIGFQTLFEANGAHHFFDPNVRLGKEIDPDENGQPTPDATGDDADGTNDDDGVQLETEIVQGQVAKLTVNASIRGFLNVWIDLNQNHNWDDMNEHVFIDVELQPGDNHLETMVPDDAVPGPTFARFRFSTVPGLGVRGLAFDGEVEDYQIEIKEWVNVSEELVIPDQFELYQNYPNPFNPVTEIRFDIPHSVFTRLEIYDLRGRIVRTLVSETRQPGQHSVVWDGKDDNGMMVSSGVYIYSLTTDLFKKSMKLAFIK